MCSVHRCAHGFSRSGIGLWDAAGVELFDRVVLIYNPVNRRVPLTLAESMRRSLVADCPMCRLCCRRPSTPGMPVSWPARPRRRAGR